MRNLLDSLCFLEKDVVEIKIEYTGLGGEIEKCCIDAAK
jgi:hypothetical protein